MKHLTFFAIFLFFLATHHFSQAQLVDPNFGYKGELMINNRDLGYPSHFHVAKNGLHVYPDGSLLAAFVSSLPGTDDNGDGRGFGIMKLRPDGRYDSTFGLNGVRLIGPAGYTYPRSMLVQPDGKILLYGGSDYYDFSLIRLLPNGTSDSTFNNSGILNYLLPLSSHITLTSVIMRPDGKYVLIGHKGWDWKLTAQLMKPDGKIDSTFGYYGIYVSPEQTTSIENAEAVLHNDSSFNILYSMYIGNGKYVYRNLKVNARGKTDSSFGVNGFRDYPHLGSMHITHLFPAIDNKSYILAKANPQGDTSVVYRLFNNTGEPDPSFGKNGQFKITGNVPVDMTMKPDSTMLINCYAYTNTNNKSILAITAQGEPDSSFGNNGIAAITTDVSDHIGANADNIFLLSISPRADSAGQFLFSRFNANGQLDITFGENGTYQLKHGGSNDLLTNIIEQPGHKFLVAGNTYDYIPVKRNWFFKRYNKDGTIDPAFGNQGMVLSSEGDVGILNHVVVLPDYSFLALGSTNAGFLIRKFTITGKVDSAFGVNGSYNPAVSSGTYYSITKLLVQQDGKIVFTGENSSHQLIVGRLTPDGKIDQSFGTNGILSIPNPTTGSFHYIGRALALTADNKIIVAAHAVSGNWLLCDMVRVNVNGTLDLSFGNNGHARFGYENVRADLKPNDVLVQPDGKVLLLYISKANPYVSNGAYWYQGGGVVRFLSNGQIDTGFGISGVYFLPDVAYKALLQADGKILVSGLINKSFITNGATNMYVLRLRADGQIDNTFGNSGMLINRKYYAVNKDWFPNFDEPAFNPAPSLLLKADSASYIYGGTISYKAEDGYVQRLQIQESIPVQKIRVIDSANSPGCKQNRIEWVTTNESGSAYFTIERSTDTVNYIRIASVTASGNTTGETKYSYVDVVPDSNVYNYRVQIWGNSGSCMLSNSVSRRADFTSPGIIQQPVLNFQDNAGIRQHVVSWKVLNQQLLDSVILQRKTNAGSFENYVSMAPKTLADTVIYSYTDNALQPGSTYTYQVIITGKNCIRSTSASVSSTVTGLFDPQNIETLQVFPNPVHSELHIAMPASLRTGQLILYSQDGRKVLEQRIVNNGAPYVKINIQSLAIGAYYIKLLSGNKIWLVKVSKL